MRPEPIRAVLGAALGFLLLAAAPVRAQRGTSAYGPAGRWVCPFEPASPALVLSINLAEPSLVFRASSREDLGAAGALTPYLPASFAADVGAAARAKDLQALARAKTAVAEARALAEGDAAMQVGARAAHLAALSASGALTAAELGKAASDLRRYAVYGPRVEAYLSALDDLRWKMQSADTLVHAAQIAARLRELAQNDVTLWLERDPTPASSKKIAVSLQASTRKRPPLEPDRFAKEIERDPSRAHRRLSRAQADAEARGLETFPFQGARPVLLRLLADLHGRLAPGSPLELERFKSWKASLEGIKAEAVELLLRGSPYAAFNDLAVRWVETMDSLLRSADPALKGTYHRDLAGPELAAMRRRKKGTFLFFSFQSVDDAYLWRARPAAAYLLGLMKIPAFGKAEYAGGPLVPTVKAQMFIDGYYVDLEEFLKHDAGHSAFMDRRDVWLFETSGRSRRELVKRWQGSAKTIDAALDRLAEADADLTAAARLTLFEVIHERGYQFELPVLRQQLDTTKWTQVVRKKFENRYWGARAPLTDGQVARLDDARAWLLSLITRLQIEQAAADAAANRGEQVVARLWPPIETFVGRPRGLNFGGAGPVTVDFDVADSRKKTSLYEVSLAQIAVDYTKPRLSAMTRGRLERLSAALRENEEVSLADGRRARLRALGLDAFGLAYAEIADGQGNSLHVDVETIAAEPRALEESERLSPTEIFKIEQVLALMARDGATEATITSAEQSTLARVLSVDAVAGRVELETAAGRIALPLELTSIHPLPESETVLKQSARYESLLAAWELGGEPLAFVDGGPVDEAGKTVAYFGVTSDPLHEAHVKIAESATRRDADTVVVVLALDHVSKGGLDRAEAARRLVALKRAFAGKKNVYVAVSRSGRYLDFARASRAALPKSEAAVVLGADNLEMLLTYNTRQELAELSALARFIVVGRGALDRAAVDAFLRRNASRLPSTFAARLRFSRSRVAAMSSSLLRALAADGEPVWKELVPQAALAALEGSAARWPAPPPLQRRKLYAENAPVVDALVDAGRLKRPERWINVAPHSRARTNAERPGSYPARIPVEDAELGWDAAPASYAPTDHVDAKVLAQDETRVPGGWADPQDVSKIPGGVTRRASLEGAVRFNAFGRPLNPRGRTGLSGRGLLGRWGPNRAADNVITRRNPETGEVEVLVIKRRDNGRWAFPGGFRDASDASDAAAAERELREEVGVSLDLSNAPRLYAGYIDSPRNTDHAWIESAFFWRHLTSQEPAPVLRPGDDAAAARWMPITGTRAERLKGTHGEVLRLLKARLGERP